MTEQETATVSCRIPSRLNELLEYVVEHDGFTNTSDFLRAAIREKLKKDHSKLYNLMVEQGLTNDASALNREVEA